MLTCHPHCLNVCKFTSLEAGPQGKAAIGDPATVQDGTRRGHVCNLIEELT